MSFVDLQIPMSGIPITVVRTYDSRVKTKQDFGVGWTLDVVSGEVTHKVEIQTGWVIATDDDPFSLPCGIVRDQKDHLTEIRLSERERYVFRPTLENAMPFSGGCRADVGFALVEGTTPNATLQVIGNIGVRAPGAIVHNPNDPLPTIGHLTDELEGTPYEPRRFQLRTEDGRTVDLQQGFGVTRIEDRNGNELFVTPAGIAHSGGESVSFTRDALGRITRITDPMGHALAYRYDGAGDLVAFESQTGDETRFVYGDRHDLQEIVDPLGVRAAQTEYDAEGRLVAVIDADGHRIQLAHDVQAREEAREDRLGFRETFQYDERGNVTRHEDREGHAWLYTYDARDNQLTARDPNGATTTWTYDASHRKTSETNPLGDTRSWTYDAQGNVLTETDFDGRVTTNTYDAKGNPLTSTAPDGAVTHFVHDTKGNLTSLTNPLGQTAHAAYDVKGQLVSTTDPAGHVTSFTYDGAGRTLTSSETRTLPGGATETLRTRFAYDAAGRLLETTDPLGHKTKSEYDAAGRVTASVDPLGRRAESIYDRLGRLVESRAADGAITRTAYDAEDQATARIDEAGRTTELFYDGNGKPTRTRYVDGTETVSAYDPAGRLSSVRDRRGYSTVFGYDLAGRQTLVRDALNHETTTVYDEAGRRSSVTDANGRTTSFGYDAAGRLTTTTHPDGTISRTEYDVLGRVTAEIDPAGTRTEFSYDAVGRLTLVRDALGGETRFEYDALGNRTAMVDALGRRRTYEYDALGRQVAETKPQGERSSRSYDAAGQEVEAIDFNGKKITRAYDRSGRLVFEQHADGTATAYAYTATGQLALVQDARGITTFAYDANDRLVEKRNPGGATLRYGYDAEGNRTSLETPSGTTSFGYDAVGRLASILDPQGGITTYGYDAAGNAASLTQPNGVQTVYGRDLRDRLTTIESRTSGGSLLARYAYTLDPAGNRTRLDEASGRSVSWQYDTLSRLLSETIEQPAQPAETEAFSYDAVGNRLTRTTASGIETSLYDANDRLLSDGVATYTWDANGNLQSKADATGTTQYRFDAKDRLVEVSGPSVGLVQHAYDHAGDRVETRVDGVATKYLVDANRGLSQVIEERGASNQLVARYEHGDDGAPLARFDAATSTATYFLHDGQGSVRQMADATQAITDTVAYSAFGKTLAATGTTLSPYRYGGQWEERRSQLYHLRARWMRAGTGRFVSTDPFAGMERDPATLHSYVYARQNPVRFDDRSGRFAGGIAEASAAMGIAANLQSLSLPFMATKLFREDADQRRERLRVAQSDPGIPQTPNIPVPDGVDIFANMRIAAAHFPDAWWFRDQVTKGGPWDYKKQSFVLYERFGNFHFGAVARAFGFPLWVALCKAGEAQAADNPGGSDGSGELCKTIGEVPLPFTGEAPYGDSSYDAYWIKRGYFWASEVLRHPIPMFIYRRY